MMEQLLSLSDRRWSQSDVVAERRHSTHGTRLSVNLEQDVSRRTSVLSCHLLLLDSPTDDIFTVDSQHLSMVIILTFFDF